MIKLMQIQTDYGVIESPYLMTLLLLIIVIPGFFGAGFILSKVITLFMISNKGAMTFGIVLSVIGVLFVLLLGYTAISV